ncbi:alanine racemase like protein [Escherichia coli]|nr:alanine racemase like protein [Escherichia coli]
MFVEALKRQNPALISAALSLWQQGKIAPDSWGDRRGSDTGKR